MNPSSLQCFPHSRNDCTTKCTSNTGQHNLGLWRDINPTQYTADGGFTCGTYVRNGGSGQSEQVTTGPSGGDTVAHQSIAHYDGFSWPILSSPISNAVYYGVNFCTNPGAPGVGLCSPNGDGSDGWLVGAAAGVGVAVYWDGAALTTVNNGLTTPTNLTSVFMVCHSPEYGSGCPSAAGFAPGLTYAVGKNATSGSIWAFNGDPKASGGWTEQKVVGITTTTYNSVYMLQDSAGNLEGFAVGNGRSRSQTLQRRKYLDCNMYQRSCPPL